jgi:hypothetical protein
MHAGYARYAHNARYGVRRSECRSPARHSSAAHLSRGALVTSLRLIAARMSPRMRCAAGDLAGDVLELWHACLRGLFLRRLGDQWCLFAGGGSVDLIGAQVPENAAGDPAFDTAQGSGV